MVAKTRWRRIRVKVAVHFYDVQWRLEDAAGTELAWVRPWDIHRWQVGIAATGVTRENIYGLREAKLWATQSMEGKER